MKSRDGIVIGTYQITNGKIVIKFGDMISDLQQIKNWYIRITGQVNQKRVPRSSYDGDLMMPDVEIPGYVPPVDTDDSLYPITNPGDLNKFGHQGTNQSKLTWQISLNRSSMITAMKTGQVEVKKNAVLVDKFNNGQVVNNVRLFNYVYGMTASNEVAYVGGYQEYSFVAVTQASNDTWQSFYNKIESSPGSYGIYKDDQGTETLMIGFGALPGSITSPIKLQDMINVVNNRNPALSTGELTNSIQGLNNLSKATNQKMFISPNITVATTVPADTPTETITNKVELYYGGAKQTDYVYDVMYQNVDGGADGVVAGEVKVVKTDDSGVKLPGIKFKLQKEAN